MDRVAAARDRLQLVQATALKAKAAGPPCSECRFRTLLGNCGNPAYAEPHFDAPKAHYEEAYFTSVQKARADDGLCGPEALLFEPQRLPAIIGTALVRGGWYAVRIAAFAVALLLFVGWLLR